MNSFDATKQIPRLPVIRNIGGCGGTMVARVIAALPGVVHLSETNPRSANLYGGSLNPVAQIHKWMPTLAESVADFSEQEVGYPPRFGDLLESLQSAAERLGLTLVIRDYNYADFVGIPYIWPVPMDLCLDQAIADRFKLVPIVLVRHPADQLASLRAHREIRSVLTAEHFLKSYHAFLSATRGTPLFRYEDLADDPRGIFPLMCASLGIPWDPSALDRFSSIKAITGNMARIDDAAIRRPDRSEAANRAERELRAFSSYDDLLSQMSYSTR